MTFSIVARDPTTGELGAAAATGLIAVGALVPHVRAGAGAIATQGWATNPFYGPEGLELLAGAAPAEAALAALTKADAGRDFRQAIVIDASGRCAGWSGAHNVPIHGTHCQENVAVAGNMLANDAVLTEMLAAYRAAAPRPLAGRLVATLEAGARAGGDRRGTCSAALVVDDGRGYPPVDLRVDFHDRPVAELSRLLDIHGQTAMQSFLRCLPGRRVR